MNHDLKAQLAKSGITHRAVAERAGVQRHTVSGMLSGYSRLSPRVRTAAEALLAERPLRLLQQASEALDLAVRDAAAAPIRERPRRLLQEANEALRLAAGEVGCSE